MINLNISKKIFNDVYFPHLMDYSNRYEIYFGGAGSGKSVLTDNIKNQTPNVVCINGDEYRSLGPKFSQIQEKYGKDSSKITA